MPVKDEFDAKLEAWCDKAIAEHGTVFTDELLNTAMGQLSDLFASFGEVPEGEGWADLTDEERAEAMREFRSVLVLIEQSPTIKVLTRAEYERLCDLAGVEVDGWQPGDPLHTETSGWLRCTACATEAGPGLSVPLACPECGAPMEERP